MIRDITLGQYYPEYSVIHKLDTRVKIIFTIAYMVSIFVISDFIGYLFIALCLAVVISMSKVPAAFIFRGVKPILFILAFTFLLNMFMTRGDPLVSFWIFKISRQGLYNAIYMVLRITFLIIGSSLLTFTTKPVKLTDGIESLLSPFNRFGLPSHELAMMMSIALRFIPTLLDETDKIMKAQAARGANFETGKLIQRAKNLLPIFVPLLVGAFRMAGDLALAMEARCYRGGEGRTKMHEFRIRKRDAIAIALFSLYMGLCICDRVFGVQDLLTGLAFGGKIW
ncbi:MAG: energy-coupling factor transporter transmembrane protein EcfT [Clostridiales Family XIII bacterium]|jgi:energy-coupling factor transport system permease protein|nr:energy-coupling factor transporter transmembrane protein EcfT [Clostridiales Family XIII bacterium]